MIAEDSGLLRHLLVQALTGRGLTVTGQAADGGELLALVAADPPDVVIADIRMPPGHGDEGLRAAEQIRRRHPGVGLLVLTHYAETAYAVRLLTVADHAVGYLVKDRVQDADRLVEAVRRVAAGEMVVDPLVVTRMLNRRRRADPLARLTPGEREVLALVAEGWSNAAIAGKLGYSAKTVEKRLSAVGGKLGLPTIDVDCRPDVNIRVLAVLAYLRAEREPGADAVHPPRTGLEAPWVL